jgi:hypothetical protein
MPFGELGGGGFGFGEGLLVPAIEGSFFHDMHRRSTGYREEPASDSDAVADGFGFLCEDQENSLGDVFGEMGIVDLSQGGGVNEVEMPTNQVVQGSAGGVT